MHDAPDSLAHALSPAAVDFDTLRERHAPFMQLGRRLLGIESNVYPLMEIWPTAFRTYNLMVPNFINVPVPFLGPKPGIGLLGTAIFASSRAAGCMYCSAHGCTIALRGGADPELLASITELGEDHGEAERALARVAVGMSTTPPSLTEADLAALGEHFRPGAVDWLTHVVAMMGFLNKMMDCLGVDLEQALAQEIDEVARASGWSPGRHRVVADERPVFAPAGSPLRTLLAMIPYMPAAIRQDGRWTRGVPASGPEAGAFLAELSGYGFPMVAAVRQGRVVRALCTMLRDNLQAEDSVVGLGLKHRAGVVFAAGLGNEELLAGTRALAAAAAATDGTDGTDETDRLDELVVLGVAPVDLEVARPGFGDAEGPEAAALLLARAMSPSPNRVTAAVVDQVTAALEPAQVMELVTWFSLLSLLHRLEVVQGVRGAETEA